MLNLQNSDVKSLNELRELAPSIFSTSPSPEVSKKYSHIPTDKVIKDMELLGWGVVDAKEVKARTKQTVGFQKHLVVFRNPDVVINGGGIADNTSPTGFRDSKGRFLSSKKVDTVFPQILLTNSHDGKNSFTFTAGLYRMICENGLVIADSKFEDFKIRHMGYDFETLQETIKEMVEKLPLTVESMNKMKSTELKASQAIQLAKDLLDLRVENTENKYDDEAIEEVLTPQREADSGFGLWEVFNRIQENIIEGNFSYIQKSGKTRQARIIKNFKQDQVLNKDMFSKALEYVA